jgi:hypothetical protein
LYFTDDRAAQTKFIAISMHDWCSLPFNRKLPDSFATAMAELTGLPFESGRKGSAWSDLGRAPDQD